MMGSYSSIMLPSFFLSIPSSCNYFCSQYWEKAKFPFHVIPKLGALRIAGGTIKVLPTDIFLCCLNIPHDHEVHS